MADLDSSLRRSLLLGRQVLERASRRRVDWARVRDADRRLGPALSESPEQAPPPTEQSSAVELRAAFSSIADFMTQTSAHCQRYHGSLSSLSDPEQRHVCRFHCGQRSAPSPQPQVGSAPSPQPQSLQDFHVQVFPGTYSVTASDPENPAPPGDSSPQRQTQLVSLCDGESVLLTFHL